jgi:hypothetical protein
MSTRTWNPLWSAVEPILRRQQRGRRLPKPNAEGWIGAILSPLRDDDNNPSFSVKPDSETDPGGYIDHATGDKGSMADLARHLGAPRPGPFLTLHPAATTLDDFARQRHLDPGRLRAVWGVVETRHNGRPALQHPSGCGVDRAKYLDGKKPKATWTGKGGRAHCYGMKTAKKIEGNTLYIVNGEPSVWAATQADVPAVCFCIGEDTAPSDEVIAELREAEFRRIVVVYDRDDAGRRGARRAVKAIRAAGLEAVALELPAELGEHGDVDDLHRRVGDRLGEVLAKLPELGEDDAVGDVDRHPVCHDRESTVGVLLSDVKREEVRWLWRNRLPRGKVTVIDGDPGLGKSTVTLDLAARISTGADMPDGTPGVLGGVVLLTAEDGLGDTVRPRLEIHGADLDRIVALPYIGEGDDRRPVTLPEDLGVIREAIRRVAAVATIIDPLMAFLGSKVDSHRDQDVRRVLAQLAALAEETGVAIIIVRHLNKTAVGNPLYRGGGSIGIIGAARAGFVVAKHPEHDNIKVLAPTKANLCRMAPSLQFVLDEIGEVVRVRWLGTIELDAEMLLASKHRGPDRPREEAEAFLGELLAKGPRPALEVFRQATIAGISRSTLKRAKAALRVRAEKVGAPGQKDQEWLWKLPGDVGADPKDPTPASSEDLVPFEESGTLRSPMRRDSDSPKGATPRPVVLFEESPSRGREPSTKGTSVAEEDHILRSGGLLPFEESETTEVII